MTSPRGGRKPESGGGHEESKAGEPEFKVNKHGSLRRASVCPIATHEKGELAPSAASSSGGAATKCEAGASLTMVSSLKRRAVAAAQANPSGAQITDPATLGPGGLPWGRSPLPRTAGQP